MTNNAISIRQYISLERIADLLCGAVDPGYEAIQYWGKVVGKVPPELWSFDERPVYKTAEEADRNLNVHYRHYYPLNEGGALIIKDVESNGTEHILDLASIKKGLAVMAKKFPSHFSQFMNEEEDGDTSDVFIQCCLFGDVIYG